MKNQESPSEKAEKEILLSEKMKEYTSTHDEDLLKFFRKTKQMIILKLNFYQKIIWILSVIVVLETMYIIVKIIP